MEHPQHSGRIQDDEIQSYEVTHQRSGQTLSSTCMSTPIRYQADKAMCRHRESLTSLAQGMGFGELEFNIPRFKMTQFKLWTSLSAVQKLD